MRRLLPLVLLFAIGLLTAGGPAGAAITLATAPTLGSATGMNGSVVLSWDVPAYDGGTKIVSYKIYRGTSPGNETLLTTVGAMTTMNDGLSIVNETTYYYKISAVNSLGEGPKSNELSARPSASITRPAAPVLNTVSASSSSGPITLSWSAPSTGGLPITGYMIHRAVRPGEASAGPIYASPAGTGTTYSDANVVPGATYYYVVTALNALGVGPASSELSARVGSGPAPPSGTPTAPTLTSAVGMNGYTTISWTAPAYDGGAAVTTYTIYRGTSPGSETFLVAYQPSTTGINDGISIVDDTTYYYRISAKNGFGEGTLSNEMSARPSSSITRPGAPSLNGATAGNGSVSLAWSAPASTGGLPITGYKIYRASVSGQAVAYGVYASLAGAGTTFTDTNVLNGATYYYAVAAVNDVGAGSGSNERSATPAAAATAPSAPSLNGATAGNGSVSLAWSAPVSNGGSAVTGYRVYRATASGAEVLLATVGNTSSYTDSPLSNGVTYFYKVSALNAVGESVLSNERSATPAAAATAPSAPSLNGATAGNGSVSLAWSAPVSNGGSAVTGYRVYRATASGAEVLLATVGNTSSYTDSPLSNGVTYFYKVSALNAVGESVLSNERSATPAAAATAPSAPSLNGATAGNGSVSLAWSAPVSNGGSAVTGYRVYRATASGAEVLLATVGNTSSYTDSPLSNGVTYFYKVSALNAVGESVLSNERSATPAAAAAVPAAPSNLTAAAVSKSQINLAWTDNSDNEAGFTIERSQDGSTFTAVATVGTNVRSYASVGLARSSTYYYRVRATGSAGASSYSNVASARTPKH